MTGCFAGRQGTPGLRKVCVRLNRNYVDLFQQHFLAYGAMAMRALALREIADEVGVHPSTISRTTTSKFMATPCGVFELKYFFSRGLATASGGTVTKYRQLLRIEPADDRRRASIDDHSARAGSGMLV